MANAALSSEKQNIVVFWVWQSLAYPIRMLVSFACILAGFGMQYYWYSFFPGLIPIFLGNLLLVVRGYDNRVRFGKYSPETGWERVEESKLREVMHLVKQMKKWDRSSIDISNMLGCFTFFVVLAMIGIPLIIAFSEGNTMLQIICIDAAVLLLPHWLTGKRSIITQPNLLLKTKLIEELLSKIQDRLQAHTVEYFMLLQGTEAKIPEDVKLRVRINNQHPDFLGFYGQIVLNTVSGTPYPYFYVVLVAKNGYGLKPAFNSFRPPRNITKEFKEQGDVEVFVIRQTTTKTSGYHTKDKTIQQIFLEGLQLAEKVAVKN